MPTSLNSLKTTGKQKLRVKPPKKQVLDEPPHSPTKKRVASDPNFNNSIEAEIQNDLSALEANESHLLRMYISSGYYKSKPFQIPAWCESKNRFLCKLSLFRITPSDVSNHNDVISPLAKEFESLLSKVAEENASETSIRNLLSKSPKFEKKVCHSIEIQHARWCLHPLLFKERVLMGCCEEPSDLELTIRMFSSLCNMSDLFGDTKTNAGVQLNMVRANENFKELNEKLKQLMSDRSVTFKIPNTASAFYVEMSFEGKCLTDVSVDFEKAVKMIVQLLVEMGKIHMLKYIHNDVKRSNIVIYNDFTKLIDFELAKKFDFYDRENQICELFGDKVYSKAGTPNMMPPEKEKTGSGYITPLTDIYCLGIVISEILDWNLTVSTFSENQKRVITKIREMSSNMLHKDSKQRWDTDRCLEYLQSENIISKNDILHEKENHGRTTEFVDSEIQTYLVDKSIMYD
ncbi:predicted protein [Naegleria gruberi]|uniref:Predicted protein n=1 Tax=Naegleria gruberi TaxID=5762 RepID=D2W131_NAEGR|nr:uncharacterized protein NAEGRDRAFT_75070 [Naegleria gruberi]EFC37291.1 predicted protein [Naegleria gruberi]|eukprot:XP_002670035.1 predicted protein [Naegleria gruberi strain NEG-M]